MPMTVHKQFAAGALEGFGLAVCCLENMPDIPPHIARRFADLYDHLERLCNRDRLPDDWETVLQARAAELAPPPAPRPAAAAPPPAKAPTKSAAPKRQRVSQLRGSARQPRPLFPQRT